MKIAFIGLGNMGAPMARNLLKAGHVLSMLDLNTQAVGALVEVSAVAVVSPEDAATGTETVITILPAAVHVRHMLTAEDGVLAGIAKGVPITDSSIIGQASAKAFGAMAAEHGNPFVDAPVSGGTGGTAADTLTFMVGGSAAAFEQVRPVLSAMSKDLVHCGGTGVEQGAKICNNLMFDITMTGMAEAMSLGKTLGIDPRMLGDIINASTGRRWGSDTYNPFPGVIDTALSSRGYAGSFGTDLMLKDLGLAGDAAKPVQQPIYLGALAQQLYQTVSSKDDGKLDFSTVTRLYREDGAA